MQNGNGLNGSGAPGAPHTVQLNPQQAAAFALQFLARAATTRAERESYDLAEMFLQAIVSGQVILAPAQPAQVVQPAAPPPVEPPAQ